MEIPASVAAVVFDLDGLLVDTESRWTIGEQILFARHGLTYGPVEKAHMIGRAVPDAALEMAEMFHRPGEADLIGAELVAEVMAVLADGVDAMPGAPELVARCADRVPVALASNSEQSYVDLVLAESGMLSYFPVRVTIEDVARGKPEPDPYLRACELLGVDPTASVAFEDSALGARAARAAGMVVVGVPSLEGAEIDCDALVASLDHPDLVAWADALTVLA